MAPNIWDILSESKRIIKSNSRHYLTLTLIFLLPLSFSSLLFQHLLIKHSQQQQQPPINPTVTLFFCLLFLLFAFVFSFSAVSSITYSVFHDFFRRPVKLPESIKSISTSFFPLLATTTVSVVILSSIFFLSGLVLSLVLFLVLHRGVDLKTYTYLVVLCTTLLMLVLLPVVTFLQVKWSLAPVIVVVESCWGLEPLRRSASLVKGMKRVAVSSFLFFWFLQGILGLVIYYLSKTWILSLAISPFLAMLMLYQFTVNTVLYIYCKDNHGELAGEELGKEEDGVSLSLIP